MPGDLRSKERTIVTLTTTGASLTSGSAGAASVDFDARSTGNFPDDFQAQFELVAQWGTITSIAINTVAAELYLVPIIDGTNLPDVDVTAGTSVLPYSAYVGAFVFVKVPTAATNVRFISPTVNFNPMLHRPYIIGRAGQTITANWSLKAVSVQAQYT